MNASGFCSRQLGQRPYKYWSLGLKPKRLPFWSMRVRENHHVAIYSFVIMPSHLHLIAQKKDGSLLSDWIRDFKSTAAKDIVKAIKIENYESRKSWLDYLFKFFAKLSKQNAVYMFWQKTNNPIEVYSPDVFYQKMDYIHNNPVAANIVTDPSYYYYSSANPFSPLIVNEH